MSRTKYKLYLDETGSPVPSTSKKCFILCGLIVDKSASEKLKIRADRIKYKYWGNNLNRIVLHSREIGLRMNEFSILRDPSIEASFHKDLFDFLYTSGCQSIIVALDLQQAQRLSLDSGDIYKKTSIKLLENFIKFLHTKKAAGEIVIESAGSKKDQTFYKIYSHYLSSGLASEGISHSEMKKILTSISFVSKNNYDIETQIADLLAYGGRVHFSGTTPVPESYDDKICKVLNLKLLTLDGNRAMTLLP